MNKIALSKPLAKAERSFFDNKATCMRDCGAVCGNNRSAFNSSLNAKAAQKNR